MRRLANLFTPVRNWAGACALLALAACAQVAPTVDAEYSNGYSREMFDSGFAFINNRYIDTVSLRELSLSGLSGLKRIDARIDVRPAGDDFEILYQNRIIDRLEVPGGDVPHEWSETTVDAIAVARRASPTLAKARAETVFKAVFDGILEPLDEFSRYDDAETATEKRAFRDGFGGIGVTIRMEETDALILAVIEGGPAGKAGVLPEDRITHIEGEAIAGWTQRQLVDRLRGRVNTHVAFTVRRPGTSNPVPISLTRAHVVPETVAILRHGSVAVARLTAFNADSARQLDRHLRREMLAPEGPPKGIVLDLRSNPGGRLDVSVDVADIFLDSGQIAATQGRHPSSRQVFSATLGDAVQGIPVVVLINGDSASASEIVTAALQDHGRGVVVGTNSFGKGTVQTVLRMPNSGEIILTWSRFLAPSGYRLHRLGVLPSVCTHGGGTTQSADSLVPALQVGDGVLASNLGEWRATGNIDTVDRETLRTICSSDGASPDVDLTVAQAILADPALYNSILRQSHTALAHR